MDNADHRFHLNVYSGYRQLDVETPTSPVIVSGGILNLKAFKSAPYTIWCIANFIAFLGLYTGADGRTFCPLALILISRSRLVLTYISVSAAAYGVSADISFYMVSIANASSGIGRIVAGIFIDRIGSSTFHPSVWNHF